MNATPSIYSTDPSLFRPSQFALAIVGSTRPANRCGISIGGHQNCRSYQSFDFLPCQVVVSYRPMTVPFATVADARKLTGKSESTIKRLIREIVGDPDHPDRNAIQPSYAEMERLRDSGEPYIWKIDPSLLLRRFPPKGATAESGSSGVAIPSGDIVVQVLQEQLHSKDEQIRVLEKQLDRKDEQISNLNERQRETNILMKELQQRLSLAPPPPVRDATVVESDPSSEPISPHKSGWRRLLHL
jgi:hypothetical protein